MSDPNGNKQKEAPEHADHGSGGHGDQGHDAAAGIIPESSWQDKLLILGAVLSLAALMYFGVNWAIAPLEVNQHGSM